MLSNISSKLMFAICVTLLRSLVITGCVSSLRTQVGDSP